jgi:dephospho-CoA kinase
MSDSDHDRRPVLDPVVGLTGGIASGKSTVSRMFRALGVPVLDADYVSRLVVQPGTPGLSAVVETFGPEYLSADGTLNRKALGDLVFNDKAARDKLSEVLGPFISEETDKILLCFRSSAFGPHYVLYENALLVELGLHKKYDALIVVTADPETQKARLMSRNNLTEAEAEARIASQAPVKDKVAVADYVIANNGLLPTSVLQDTVEKLHEILLTRFGARHV